MNLTPGTIVKHPTQLNPFRGTPREGVVKRDGTVWWAPMGGSENAPEVEAPPAPDPLEGSLEEALAQEDKDQAKSKDKTTEESTDQPEDENLTDELTDDELDQLLNDGDVKPEDISDEAWNALGDPGKKVLTEARRERDKATGDLVGANKRIQDLEAENLELRKGADPALSMLENSKTISRVANVEVIADRLGVRHPDLLVAALAHSGKLAKVDVSDAGVVDRQALIAAVKETVKQYPYILNRTPRSSKQTTSEVLPKGTPPKASDFKESGDPDLDLRAAIEWEDKNNRKQAS